MLRGRGVRAVLRLLADGDGYEQGCVLGGRSGTTGRVQRERRRWGDDPSTGLRASDDAIVHPRRRPALPTVREVGTAPRLVVVIAAAAAAGASPAATVPAVVPTLSVAAPPSPSAEIAAAGALPAATVPAVVPTLSVAASPKPVATYVVPAPIEIGTSPAPPATGRPPPPPPPCSTPSTQMPIRRFASFGE